MVIVSVGASEAIFGLVGAAAALLIYQRIKQYYRPLSSVLENVDRSVVVRIASRLVRQIRHVKPQASLLSMKDHGDYREGPVNLSSSIKVSRFL